MAGLTSIPILSDAGFPSNIDDPHSLHPKQTKPVSFVCQRCLRPLDVSRSLLHLSYDELDSNDSYDIIKFLEKPEPFHWTQQIAENSSSNLLPIPTLDSRNPNASSSSSTSITSLNNFDTASSNNISASISTGSGGRKKNNDEKPSLSRTFTSLFKSHAPPVSSTATVDSNMQANGQSLTAGRKSVVQQSVATPKNNKASNAKNAAASTETTPIQSNSNNSSPSNSSDESDSPSPPPRIRRFKKTTRTADPEVMDFVPIDASTPTSPQSSSTSTATTNTTASSTPLNTENSIQTPAFAVASSVSSSFISIPNSPDAIDEDGFTPISASVSVSRAAMRDKSKGPAIKYSGWKSSRDRPGMNISSDYVSKRVPIGKDNSFNTNSPTVDPRKIAQLFELMCLDSLCDLPLCTECAPDTCHELDEEIYDLEEEIAYLETEYIYLSHPHFKSHSFDRILDNLKNETDTVQSQLESTKRNILALCDEQERLNIFERDLLLAKIVYWRAFEVHAAEREAMLENMVSAHNRLSHTTRRLDIMRSSLTINDAYHISMDLHLATICNLRVGRLPGIPVEWSEISAAFGLALHLLQELASKAGYSFTKYSPVLYGSYSGLQKIATDGFLSLHADADISMVRLVQFQGVNNALAAFLECVVELSNYLKTTKDENFVLPFPIVRDTVNGLSIRRAWPSSGNTWSGALRALMANLKAILAWEARNGFCK